MTVWEVNAPSFPDLVPQEQACLFACHSLSSTGPWSLLMVIFNCRHIVNNWVYIALQSFKGFATDNVRCYCFFCQAWVCAAIPLKGLFLSQKWVQAYELKESQIIMISHQTSKVKRLISWTHSMGHVLCLFFSAFKGGPYLFIIWCGYLGSLPTSLVCIQTKRRQTQQMCRLMISTMTELWKAEYRYCEL